MRLLLLTAVFLRLVAPTGGEHCAPVGEQAPVPAEHAHHGEAPACDHCPPAECASQPACAAAFCAAVVATPFAASPLERGAPSLPAHQGSWASRDHRPPVPPPQLPLT